MPYHHGGDSFLSAYYLSRAGMTAVRSWQRKPQHLSYRFFLIDPQRVVVSSPDYLQELIETYRSDPLECDDSAKKANATPMLF
jgi:hypothetical protein